MLGFHRQRRTVHGGHRVSIVPGGEEVSQHRSDGADGAQDHEILLDAGQQQRFPRADRRRGVPLVEVELHLRQ